MCDPRRRPSPPYNPGVRRLVDLKEAADSKSSIENRRRGFRGWHERGYLPHRDVPGVTQFITYHLTDSFPATLRGEWAALLELEEDKERHEQLEAYLDKGRGECWLKRPEIAAICEDAFRHFDQQRYALKAWCLMPNHVHVLAQFTTAPMSDVIKAWKGFTARRCNELLRRQGAFWADGYYDTYIRDGEHERGAIRYIESNPVKAGLAQEPAQWAWSSARFRDAGGVLRIA